MRAKTTKLNTSNSKTLEVFDGAFSFEKNFAQRRPYLNQDEFLNNLLQTWLQHNKCSTVDDLCNLINSIHQTELMKKERSYQKMTESRFDEFYNANEDLLTNNPQIKAMIAAINQLPSSSAHRATLDDRKLRILAYIILSSNDTHPIIHENVLNLISNFLSVKREYGTTQEKKFYAKMTEEHIFGV